MSSNYWITTIDNDLNPFTHFYEWFNRDRELGYNTCGWIAHEVKTSIQLDDDVIEDDVDFGVESFLALNPFGMHYKVYEDEADKLIPLMYNTYKKEIEPMIQSYL